MRIGAPTYHFVFVPLAGMSSVIYLVFHAVFIAVVCLITLILRRAIGRERNNLIRKTRIMKENEFIEFFPCHTGRSIFHFSRASLHDKILLKMVQNATKRSTTSQKITLSMK